MEEKSARECEPTYRSSHTKRARRHLNYDSTRRRPSKDRLTTDYSVSNHGSRYVTMDMLTQHHHTDTIVVSDDVEGQLQQQLQQEQLQEQQPSKQEEVLTAVQEVWDSTSKKVKEAWDAVTHHTVTQVEQTQRAVGPALEHAGNSLEEAGNSVRGHVAAVHQSASDLSQAAGDHTRGLSMATQVAALTTLQATKQLGDD
jgi:hypothetical protein